MKDEGAALELTPDILDRALLARLIEEPPATYPIAPVPYLLGCYARAAGLPATAPGGAALNSAVKDALLAHLWLCLNEDAIVPQPEHLAARGSLQLWDALWAAVPHSRASAPHSSTQEDQKAPVPLPAGLLSHSLRAFPEETTGLLGRVLVRLGQLASVTSILGDFNALNSCWFRLLESKELAAAIASSPELYKQQRYGRQFQAGSPLALLVGITYLPDPMPPEPQPSTTTEMLAGRSDPALAQTLFEAPSAQHVTALHQLFSAKGLLSKAARPATLAWLAAALADTERRKTYMQLERATSNGFMHNLLRILLQLCEPFLDFYSGKASQFIQCGCALALVSRSAPRRLVCSPSA